jgi:hypothetical protein
VSWYLVLATRAAAVLLAVGTASAASALDDGSPPPTAAAYRAQASAICTTANRQSSARPAGLTLSASIAVGLKIARNVYASLSRVTPPSQLARAHAEVLANIKAGLGVVTTLLGRAKAGDLTAKQFVTNHALDENVSRRTALWQKIGVAACEGH